MIIRAEQFAKLPSPLAMVDGCFDPIHRGHIAYFRFASTLGVPVLCNAAPDEYLLARKQRAPLLSQEDRLAVLDAIRYLDYVCVAQKSTAHSLRSIHPTFYVKGSDWIGKLPQEEQKVCAELGIQIVYADCPLDSSTRILKAFVENQNVRRAV